MSFISCMGGGPKDGGHNVMENAWHHLISPNTDQKHFLCLKGKGENDLKKDLQLLM